MSWIVSSFALLSVALLAGFAWYERSRPSAHVVALVGTLAALAVLGRIAFAPIPNVKPTTDIVLIAGFALGGAPGFMVGAVTALVSNLFFAQGPWTPWQMAAWGGVGIAGAALARATRGRAGRLRLALACGLAGLAFGAVMNVSTWITLSGEQSLAQLGAVFAAAAWFDVAHAAGNVAFCLAFGPALVAALVRFRDRMEISWRPLPASGAAGALAAVALGAGVLLAGAPSAQAASGGAFLVRAQNADGGFGGARGQGSNQLHTGWAALGLASTGRNPLDVRRGGRTPIDYMRRGARSLTDVGEIERTILVLAASGVSPRRFGGRNLVADLVRRRRADGSFGGLVNHTAFGVLALRAAGRPPQDPAIRDAVRWLVAQQGADGGFSYAGRHAPSGVDDTGTVLQALAAAGRRSSRSAERALRFVRSRQNADGGFALVRGGPSNAQSTAWAVQGVVAMRRDPARLRRGSGRSAIGFLRSLQAEDGSVRYSRTSRQTPVWVTAQAVTALERKAFPLRRVPRRRAARRATASAAAAPASPSEPAPGGSGGASERSGAGRGGEGGDPARGAALVAALVPSARDAGAVTGLLMSPLV